MSSKSEEFHPGYRTLVHFQVSLVISPLLAEPSIPNKPHKSLPFTEITRVSPGTSKEVAVLQQLLSFPRLLPSANISMASSQANVALKSAWRKDKNGVP